MELETRVRKSLKRRCVFPEPHRQR